MNVARALRFQGNLPLRFLGDCVLAATHIINRTPSVANNGMTPYEMLYNKPPTYEHFKVFGCIGYVRNAARQMDKFDPSADQCVFIGYPIRQKGWKVYNLRTKDFLVSRDVIFYEEVFPFASNIGDETQIVNANLDLQHGISHFPDETEPQNDETERD